MKSNVGARFRTRKINHKQLLRVYRAVDIPDLDESLNLQRSIPQTETGVDKEEESEHHLQAAISASNLSTTTGEATALYIPTPDASRRIENYRQFYSRPFTEPSTLIRFSSTVEDCMGCPYNMDDGDEKWLADFNAKLPASEEKLDEDHFEMIMWQFEKITNEKVPYLQLDSGQIPPFDDFQQSFTSPQLNGVKSKAPSVYPYWHERRTTRGGKVITPQLKFEEVMRNESDPYLCFRRRESKPIRKTRRADQASIEKLRKLRMEMESARSLLEMVSRREKVRKESLVLEHMIFIQRGKVREIKRNLGIKDEEDDLAHQKKKSRKSGESSATIRIPLNFKDRDASSLDDPRKDRSALSSIESELAKRREDDIGWEDLTDNPNQQQLMSPYAQQFYRIMPHAPLQRTGRFMSFRKRVGRGGRIHIDRQYVSRSRNHYQNHYQKEMFGGQFDGVNTFDKFRFDDDSFDQEDMVDDLRDGMIRYRCTLLSETDLRSLSTSTRHHFISIGHNGHSQ
ncbi:Enhancer of polycomb-like protein 1 [Gryganskiella cystojenkinii]|nr:Enhancer of polycomb-like protein 1 [Gryganskiella cystojenkinii]